MAGPAAAMHTDVTTSHQADWEADLLHFKDVGLYRHCIQCGTCSGSCNVAHIADYTPRMIVNLVARGDVESALKSRMIFLCTNCLACSTRCPRDIPVADLMMRLRNIAISVEVASLEDDAAMREFVKNVLKRGRVYEPELMVRFAMRTSPISLLGMRNLALSLFQKGKLGLPSRSRTDLSELKSKLRGRK